MLFFLSFLAEFAMDVDVNPSLRCAPSIGANTGIYMLALRWHKEVSNMAAFSILIHLAQFSSGSRSIDYSLYYIVYGRYYDSI